LGGGRASYLTLTGGGDGDINNDKDEVYNVKNGIIHLD
jgi:hypothetical protein